jgi:glycerate kinase
VAVVEVAAAGGLGLAASGDHDAPASTRGTGELVVAARDSGAGLVLIAAGGSGVTDGGLGAIEAIEEAEGIGATRLRVLCDVRTREVSMTEAAGGLPGGLRAAFDAELVTGAGQVLDAIDFDARMRAARAVVTGEGRLGEQSLAGRLVAEVATRARQAGVPCHAVVGRRELDDFGARMLDLQQIIEARTSSELEAAGRRLAEVL